MFLSLTPGASPQTRAALARMIATFMFFLLLTGAALTGIFFLSLSVYLCFRFADRRLRPLGDTGTTVFLRLSAFVLLCVGVQIFCTGAAELLAPWKPLGR